MPALIDFSPLGKIGDTFLRAIEAQREREEGEAAVREALGPAGSVSVRPASQSATGIPAAPAAAGPRSTPSFVRMAQADPEIERLAIETAKAQLGDNPIALAAFMAHGQAESAWNPSRIVGSWSDPSKSGKRGTSGGALSWRDPEGKPDRLTAMRSATAGAGDDPKLQTVAQVQYAFNENPALTARLKAAKSLEEAHALLASSQRYADWDVPTSAENRKRLQLAQSYAQRFGGGQATPAPAGGGEQLQAPFQARGIEDPQTRAVLAQMLRKKETRQAARLHILQMRQKQAGQPFQFQNGWYQADGDGNVKEVVKPRESYVDQTDKDGNVWRVEQGTGKRELVQAAPEDLRKLNAAGVTPTSPEGRRKLVGRDDKVSAFEQKMVTDAEEEQLNVKDTITTLRRALSLNPQVHSKAFAGTRGWLGSKLPDQVVPDWVSTPEQGRATEEWQQVMNLEAIKTMAATLKGATTDSELNRFVSILSDPQTDPATRQRTIERMISLGEKKAALNEARIAEGRAGTYFKPGGGEKRPLPPGYTPERMVAEARSHWRNATPAQRDAIAARLAEYGINTRLDGAQ